MLLSASLGAPVASSSAHKSTGVLAPSRATAPLRRGVVGSRIARERSQPAGRRPTSLSASVQAIQDTYNTAYDSTVAVTFTLARKVEFGEHVVLVGNDAQLGAWELGRAPHMSWSEGDTWTVTVDLPAGSDVEYKFVLTADGRAPIWEKCENRRVVIDPASVGTVACDWDVQEAHVTAPQHGNSPLANGSAAAAAALSAAAAALEQKDRATALAAVQEAAAAAAAVVAAAEATAAAVAKAVAAAEALVNELDGPAAAGLQKSSAEASKVAAASTQAAADARYSAEQLEFMRRKLDAIQAMPAVSRQASPGPGSSELRNGSPQPASRPASPPPAAPAANGSFTPEQLAFLQRKRASSQSPAPSSPPPRPRSSSPAPRQRSPSPAAPPPPPRAASPAPDRARSASPRPVSAVYAKDVSKYSPEQLEFLRRSGKL